VSAKIEHIDLWPGDHVFVRVKGCAELNVLVEVAKDGKATVRGPFNCKSRKFEILTGGLRELPDDNPPEDIARCENCGGSGYISYNPNLNPNAFPATASAKCTRCGGTGIEDTANTTGQG
jgi:hypothetical protein